ncbi:MAG: hypothetical protein F2873_00160 [Actinobacteria bacterium]|uniref:Unannotated protein n=1 Tax=freshwater metagenome TaxID=449393 RepID=A0A6J6YNR5_9ZZZZ|nr:hypothetical protein [Actinomycetota bacterium]MSX80011.1 hypothetical protein [Actinomycetota bacterium]
MRLAASRRRPLLRFASLLPLIVTAGASCTSGDSSLVNEPSTRLESDDELAIVAPLPLSSLLFRSAENERIVFARQQELVRRCMEDRGFSYPAVRFVAQPTELTFERPFGVWLHKEAQARGYRGPKGDELDYALDTYVAGLDSAAQSTYLYAFNGVGAVPAGRSFPNGLPAAGTSGCVQLALNKLLGDFASYEGDRVLVQKLVNDAYATAMGDPRVAAALKAWRQCMRATGYDVRTPDEALQTAQSGEVATANEIKQAVADVDCKVKSGLMSSWYRAKQDAEQRLLEENYALAERLRDYRAREAS